MSHWTHIFGIVEVRPAGRTQPEKRYILDTVLEHLPVVRGSEGNMKVHVVQQYGHSSSSTHNEFDESMWVRRDHDHDGWTRTQDKYTLVLEGHLRDTEFDGTLCALNKWLNRLAKRLWVTNILVKLSDGYKTLVLDDPEPYSEMTEEPSWSPKNNGEPAWFEYLMWDAAKGTRYPMKLMYKYYDDPENDAEVERRMAYERSG